MLIKQTCENFFESNFTLIYRLFTLTPPNNVHLG